MFTITELKSIDETYFDIIHADSYSVTLQSKNTKHYWHITYQQYRTFSSCKIQHRHDVIYPFHDQGSAPNLKQVIEKIKNHDQYHLHERPKKKRRAKIPA